MHTEDNEKYIEQMTNDMKEVLLERKDKVETRSKSLATEMTQHTALDKIRTQLVHTISPPVATHQGKSYNVTFTRLANKHS